MIRRALLCVLVLICALLVLASCATPDVVCDMRVDYATDAPEATEGLVLIRWMYGRDAYLPANTYGMTECFSGDPRFCLIQMKGSPSSYHNVCGIARVRHEEKHAMGAKHEQ